MAVNFIPTRMPAASQSLQAGAGETGGGGGQGRRGAGVCSPPRTPAKRAALQPPCAMQAGREGSQGSQQAPRASACACPAKVVPVPCSTRPEHHRCPQGGPQPGLQLARPSPAGLHLHHHHRLAPALGRDVPNQRPLGVAGVHGHAAWGRGGRGGGQLGPSAGAAPAAGPSLCKHLGGPLQPGSGAALAQAVGWAARPWACQQRPVGPLRTHSRTSAVVAVVACCADRASATRLRQGRWRAASRPGPWRQPAWVQGSGQPSGPPGAGEGCGVATGWGAAALAIRPHARNDVPACPSGRAAHPRAAARCRSCC